MIKVQWKKVIEEWDKPYINWIDLGNCTMFRLSAFKVTSPRIGIFVGVESRGNFFFPINKPIHWQYVEEKLSLFPADAKPIADWINAQIGFNHDQQGDYFYISLSSLEPYHAIGEQSVLMWYPEVIK